MSFERWLFFATTELLLCLTPGPAVLFVISHALARGGRASLWANAGILAGNSFYFALSAVGLGAVLLASHTAFTVITYAGAGYLVYLGIRTTLGGGVSPGAALPAARSSDGWRTLARGFALQVSNPKALVFFLALLPQFVDPSRSVAAQVVLLAVTSVAIEFAVLGAYGYVSARAAVIARQPRFVTATNRISGGLLVAAGAGVALAEGR